MLPLTAAVAGHQNFSVRLLDQVHGAVRARADVGDCRPIPDAEDRCVVYAGDRDRRRVGGGAESRGAAIARGIDAGSAVGVAIGLVPGTERHRTGDSAGIVSIRFKVDPRTGIGRQDPRGAFSDGSQWIPDRSVVRGVPPGAVGRVRVDDGGPGRRTCIGVGHVVLPADWRIQIDNAADQGAHRTDRGTGVFSDGVQRHGGVGQDRAHRLQSMAGLSATAPMAHSSPGLRPQDMVTEAAPASMLLAPSLPLAWFHCSA